MKLNKNSLKIKVLLYLLLFSIVILLFLWFFQVISLNSYYELSIKRELGKVVKNVNLNYDKDNYDDIFNVLSHEEDMCIEIYNNSRLMFSSIRCNNIVLQRGMMEFKNDFAMRDTPEEEYEFEHMVLKTKTLIRGIRFEDGNFAFVSVSLNPVDGTVNILKSQFLYVALIVFSISIIVAYLISNRISKPIEKLNDNAHRLVNGKYEPLDLKNNIAEIQELSNTLNYVNMELSKTEELRKELMANVSHDLKTPLTMIKAYAEMIRDLTYKDKKKREDNLNVIINETDRLNLLVNDILDLSRFQSDIYELNKERMDLSELLKTVISSYDIYSINDGYVFKYEGVDNIIVNADRLRIEQVLRNLINNAINYTGNDKQIVIRLINEDDYYRIEVSDTGKGIKDEDLDYIWDKYYKADKTHSRKTLGTGIGLSIVKSILDAHGYEYGVNTKKNKGTTFYFNIEK